MRIWGCHTLDVKVSCSPRQWPFLSFQGSHEPKGQCACSCHLEPITLTCGFTGQEQVGWGSSRTINEKLQWEPQAQAWPSAYRKQAKAAQGEVMGTERHVQRGAAPQPSDWATCGGHLGMCPSAFSSHHLKTSHPVTEFPAVVIAMVIKATYTSSSPSRHK